jgi:hypothetical protein
VWSRLGCGSTTRVGPPSARSPARRTADFTWALATVRRLDTRAHLAQRLGDAFLGTARERLVADELEAALLAGEDPRSQPHHRPRVAEVERPVRLAQAAQSESPDANRLPGLLHLRAEVAYDRDRRVGVSGATEALDQALAVRDRAEQDGALRDPLHAGNGDGALDRRRGLDLHSSRTGETTTP